VESVVQKNRRKNYPSHSLISSCMWNGLKFSRKFNYCALNKSGFCVFLSELGEEKQYQNSTETLYVNRLNMASYFFFFSTAYGLDGPGIESRWGRDFPYLSTPTLRPTQPPVQWVPGLSRG